MGRRSIRSTSGPPGSAMPIAFISLGNKAYFLRYSDRPANTPQCCQFSRTNHAPQRDFIKHVPFSARDSRDLRRAAAFG